MQIGPPDEPAVKTSWGEFPVVADHLAFEVFVEAFAPAGHAIVGANPNPEELEGLVGLRGVSEDFVLACFSNRGTEGGDMGEFIGVFETDGAGRL